MAAERKIKTTLTSDTELMVPSNATGRGQQAACRSQGAQRLAASPGCLCPDLSIVPSGGRYTSSRPANSHHGEKIESGPVVSVVFESSVNYTRWSVRAHGPGSALERGSALRCRKPHGALQARPAGRDSPPRRDSPPLGPQGPHFPPHPHGLCFGRCLGSSLPLGLLSSDFQPRKPRRFIK